MVPKPTLPEPLNRKAVREAQESLDYLELCGFDTGAMRLLAREFLTAADPVMSARTFIAALHSLIEFVDFQDEDTLDATHQVAAFLVLAFGREAVEAAIAHELRVPYSQTRLSSAIELAMALGLDIAFIQMRTPAETRQDVNELADRILEPLSEGEAGILCSCSMLAISPRCLRHDLMEALLRRGPARKEFPLFVAIALLFPLEQSLHDRLRIWLSEHGGSDGAWWLRQLGEGGTAIATPSKNFAQALPTTWRVLNAYASIPNGDGDQELILTRRRPDHKVAFFSAVVSDIRGIASGLSLPDASKREVKTMMKAVGTAAGGLIEVPPGYVLRRLEEGRAMARSLGMPVSPDVESYLYLLSGLRSDLAPEFEYLLTSWRDPDRLHKTADLMREPFARSWVLEETPDSETFFEAAEDILRAHERAIAHLPGRQAAVTYTAEGINKLDKLIESWLPRLLNDEERRLWHRRLAETAYLMHLQKEPYFRDLAATAAWAIAPNSGVPLEQHPLAMEQVRQSVFAGMALDLEIEEELSVVEISLD
jgi:hypothetical protein